jgi:hypothetical protein
VSVAGAGCSGRLDGSPTLPRADESSGILVGSGHSRSASGQGFLGGTAGSTARVRSDATTDSTNRNGGMFGSGH